MRRVSAGLLMAWGVGGCALGSNAGERESAALGDGTESESGASNDPDDGAAQSSDGSGDPADDGASADDDDGAGSPSCGDGMVDPTEECDDANANDGDGCNSDCRVSGQVRWEHVVSGSAGHDDEAFGIVQGPDASLYVVGYRRDAGGTPDGWLGKLNPLGGMLWTKTHAGSSGGNDQMRAIVSDTAGLLYAAGFQHVADQNTNLWVRKYDDTGEAKWTDIYDGPANGNDGAIGITIDAAGDILVAGHRASTTGGRDLLLRKYTPEGEVLWTRSFNGEANGNDQGSAVVASLDGHAYVVGHETVTGEGRNTWLGKYDVDGNLVWSRGHNGGGALDDELRAVTVADDGVVVCGFERKDDIPWQSYVRKYDAQGGIVWTEIYRGSSDAGALCLAIARDASGDLVWAGSENAGMIQHALVRRLDPDGNLRWSTQIEAMGDGPDAARALHVGMAGRIFVAGSVAAGADALDIWAAELTP